MARLQDFSNVTPSSSSDKLLIVQSAGQGLATLDTVGQQIANNTSVSQLNTTRKTLVGAVNEVNAKADSFIYSDSSVANFIDLFASIPDNKTVGFLINSNTVSNCPVPYPMGVIVKRNSNTAYIQLTQLNGIDASYIGRIVSGVLSWRKITTTS